MIIHVWQDHNKTYRIDDSYDNVLHDGFTTTDEAEDYVAHMYPNATLYPYIPPTPAWRPPLTVRQSNTARAIKGRVRR